MTQAEWISVVKVIQANWAHSQIPNESVAVWYTDVKDLTDAEALAAVSAFSRDGEKFPPNGGQIRAKVLEMRQADELDHGAAWGIAMKAIQKFGHIREDKALAWLEERSPVLAEAVRRFGWKDLCMFDLNNESTVRAQFRDIFNNVRRAAERDERYKGLGAKVRQKRLEPRSIKDVIEGFKEQAPKELKEG